MTSDEIIAYCRGVQVHTGVRITAIAGGSPRATIKDEIFVDVTPTKNAWDGTARCSTANHEVAHVWFRTVHKTVGWAENIAKQHNADKYVGVAHECINVIVDIFDETRMEKIMPGTAKTFTIGNAMAAKDLHDNGASKNMPEWRWACIQGILHKRLMPTNWWDTRRGMNKACYRTGWLPRSFDYRGSHLCRAYYDLDHWQQDIVRICGRAGEKSKPKNPQRRIWNRIFALSDELFGAVLPHLTADDEGGETQPGDDQGNGTGKTAGETVRVGVEKGGDVAATHMEGGGGAGTGSTSAPRDNGKLDKDVYTKAKAAFDSAIDEIMETDSASTVDRNDVQGDSINPKRWSHVFTDGAVFRAPTKSDGREAAIAILLDCSSSMSDNCRMGKSAAVCKAFAEVAESRGATVAVWKFGGSCERADVVSLDYCQNMGGTRGAEPIRYAHKWLMGEATDNRMLVIVTDGALADKDEASERTKRAVIDGIKPVIVGVGIDAISVKRGWNGYVPVVASKDANVYHLVDALTPILAGAMVGV